MMQQMNLFNTSPEGAGLKLGYLEAGSYTHLSLPDSRTGWGSRVTSDR